MTSKEALEIVYRKSCLPTKQPPMECRYCKLGQESKCELYTAYMRLRKDLELLEILLSSLLKKPITNGTDSNKMILLDSESYNKIKELLNND